MNVADIADRRNAGLRQYQLNAPREPNREIVDAWTVKVYLATGTYPAVTITSGKLSGTSRVYTSGLLEEGQVIADDRAVPAPGKNGQPIFRHLRDAEVQYNRSWRLQRAIRHARA